jgi:hypothetical protein
MDQHEQDTAQQYEAPIVDDLAVDEGPATVQAGNPNPSLTA